MPKLPQASGDDVVRLLKSMSYKVIRQRGSHIGLQKVTSLGEHNITVPAHKVLAKGTLSDILNKISLWNNISKPDLIKRLK
jgi:predicted RNA binding protein YcfA (HicA-like mRNA interferase family)